MVVCLPFQLQLQLTEGMLACHTSWVCCNDGIVYGGTMFWCGAVVV